MRRSLAPERSMNMRASVVRRADVSRLEPQLEYCCATAVEEERRSARADLTAISPEVEPRMRAGPEEAIQQGVDCVAEE